MTATPLKTRLSVALILLLSACGTAPAVPGWQGSDVHLVDGSWIGTETACGAGDDALECRTIVELTMGALAPDLRIKVTKAVPADLPTTFVTAAGETRTARLGVGIMSRRAVVLDLVDGNRRVLGLMCYLPYSGTTSRLMVADATCEAVPLDFWRDGNVPP